MSYCWVFTLFHLFWIVTSTSANVWFTSQKIKDLNNFLLKTLTYLLATSEKMSLSKNVFFDPNADSFQMLLFSYVLVTFHHNWWSLWIISFLPYLPPVNVCCFRRTFTHKIDMDIVIAFSNSLLLLATSQCSMGFRINE